MSSDHDYDPDVTDPGVPVHTQLPPLPAAGSRRARRRRFGKLTFVLAGVLIAVVGFFVGSPGPEGPERQLEHRRIPQRLHTPGRAWRRRRRRARRRRRRGRSRQHSKRRRQQHSGGGGGGNVTFGQVKLVDGDNLYVTNAQGNTVKVSAASAQITTSQPGTLNDLKPGETVIVQGQTAKDGTVNATSVSTGGGGGGLPTGGTGTTP